MLEVMCSVCEGVKTFRNYGLMTFEQHVPLHDLGRSRYGID
jgi:hypothetical protein